MVLSQTGYLHRNMVAWRMKFSGRQRGIVVDHSTINRWVVKYVLLLVEQAKNHKRKVGISWRLDETYIKVRGQWKYLYRAVDKDGNTVDFLLTAKRDTKAALRFLGQAIRNNCPPVKSI